MDHDQGLGAWRFQLSTKH